GGEVSDTGSLSGHDGESAGRVTDVRKHKLVPGLIYHVVTVDKGSFKLNDMVRLAVDNGRRHDIRRNHTATHILHEELRRRLGKHVTQQGSLVAPERLR
ncbi:MAG: alanine--tRNA ligase, partial [Anaerolineales bacterium]|nr:alanine--tRNA ligase [Anaerolineales bacterium]